LGDLHITQDLESHKICSHIYIYIYIYILLGRLNFL
jgi:hypothetical protein